MILLMLSDDSFVVRDVAIRCSTLLTAVAVTLRASSVPKLSFRLVSVPYDRPPEAVNTAGLYSTVREALTFALKLDANSVSTADFRVARSSLTVSVLDSL